MRIIQTIISAEGFREAISNKPKLVLLDHLLQQTAPQLAHLLVLPTGFLAVPSIDDVPI